MRRWTTVGLLLAVIMGLAAPAAAVPQDDVDPPLPEPEGEGRAPAGRPRVGITDVTSDGMTLGWGDASAFEDRYEVYQRAVDGTLTLLGSRPPLDGDARAEFELDGLTPDTEYCFQVRAVNRHGSSPPGGGCRYTRDTRDNPAMRVRLGIRIADRNHAGTDSSVIVRLARGESGWWLDSPHDDFERGSYAIFDVPTTGVTEWEDITQVRLSMFGDDAMCVSQLRLIVNSSTAADFDYGDDDCRWVGDGQQLFISHQALRSGDGWRVHPGPFLELVADTPTTLTYRLTLDEGELRHRIEGLVGHQIARQPAYWGEISGEAVELRQVSDDRLGVDLDLAGKADHDLLPDWLLDDPEVDVDFHLRVAVTADDEEDGGFAIEITPVQFTTSVDTNWATEFVLDILPCGPIASIITGDGIPGCASHLERLAERAIAAQIALTGQNVPIDAGDACCLAVEARVTPAAAIEIDVTIARPDSGPAGPTTTAPGVVTDVVLDTDVGAPSPGGPTRPGLEVVVGRPIDPRRTAAGLGGGLRRGWEVRPPRG